MGFHAMVRETVKETCPAIDRGQAMLREIHGYMIDPENGIDFKDNGGALYQRINSKLHDIHAHLENLRADNTKLRAIACEALARAEKAESGQPTSAICS